MHKEFEVHLLNEGGIGKARVLANIFNEALTQILTIVPAGRELSIVRTKLEEASFFAKKGIANNPENQKEKV